MRASILQSSPNLGHLPTGLLMGLPWVLDPCSKEFLRARVGTQLLLIQILKLGFLMTTKTFSWQLLEQDATGAQRNISALILLKNTQKELFWVRQ